MRTFFALICSAFAGAIVFIGCTEDKPHYPPHVSRSCDAVAVDENDHVLAAINSVGTNGHVDLANSLDDEPVPPEFSADVWRYNEFGQRRIGRDFWGNPGAFAMTKVSGVRPLSGERTLVAGVGGGFVSAVVDSVFQFERAQYWRNDPAAYWMTAVPAGENLACLYEDSETGPPFRLAFLNVDGEAISDVGEVDATVYPPPRLAGLSNGNAVVIDGSIVSEYLPLMPSVEWVLNSQPRRFGAAGEDIDGNLTIFGTFDADSLSNQLVVVTSTEDTVMFRSCYISGGAIDEVSAAARSADSTWLIACVTSPSRDFCVLRYDGTDTVQVVGNWVPEGDPVTTCAATGSNGWMVFGGYIRHPGNPGRQDAFVRTYTRAGQPGWADTFNGE